MKKTLLSRMFPMLAIASLSMAEAAPAAAAPAGQAPTSNDPAVAGAAAPKTRAPKNPDNILDIINGRLPLALVHMIRFGETGSNAEIAKKYGTSVGKVFDIKKGRNFGYIDQAYKPSAEEVSAAKAWCETGKTAKGKTLAEAGGNPTDILTKLTAMGVATAEEVAKRNWQTRVVGQAAPVAGTAPAAAPAATGAQATATAEKPAGAKLF